MKPRKRLFDYVRKHRSGGPFKRAAEFIYLNKSSWNGLYRVNSLGEFNVPFGRPKTDFITDFNNLRECGKLLRSSAVSLRVCDFEDNILDAKRGDLVYVDPPFVTGHSNNGFVDYNEELFSWEDQERLAHFVVWLARKGVHVIVSNADHEPVLRLYPGFGLRRITRFSTLASDLDKRRQVSEVLLYSKS